MNKYNVYSLDVWGNEEDGYEVNDRSFIGTIELYNEFTDQDVIQALLEADILNSFSGKVVDMFDIQSEEGHIDIDYKDKPLLELEEVA